MRMSEKRERGKSGERTQVLDACTASYHLENNQKFKLLFRVHDDDF